MDRVKLAEAKVAGARDGIYDALNHAFQGGQLRVDAYVDLTERILSLSMAYWDLGYENALRIYGIRERRQPAAQKEAA